MIHKFCCQYYIFDKFYSMYDIAFVLFVNSVLHNICILYKLYCFILWFLWNSFTRHMFILRYHCTINVRHRVWPQYWVTASQGSHPHSYRWPVASSAPRSGRPSRHGSCFLWFWVFLLPHLYSYYNAWSYLFLIFTVLFILRELKIFCASYNVCITTLLTIAITSKMA